MFCYIQLLATKDFSDCNENESETDSQEEECGFGESTSSVDSYDDILIGVNDENSVDGNKVRKRRRFHVPRLLLRDQRRFYVDMCASVFNSNDFHLLYGMFNTYAVPTVTQTTYQLHAKQPTESHPSSTVELQYNGIPAIAKFWYTLFQLGPDALVQITDKTIATSPDTKHSKIIAKYIFTATKHFEVDTNNTNFDSTTSETYNNTPTSPKRRLVRTITNSNPEKTLQPKVLSILEEPFRITVEGRFIMYTDENKMIYKMEMESLPHRRERVGNSL